MLWTIIAWILAPIGLLACFLLLTGNETLERWGAGICGASLAVGPVALRLDRMCALVAVVTFSAEVMKLNGGGPEAVSVEMQDRQMMHKLRHERNYWISLYVLSLWVVASRVASLVDLKRKSRPKWE